MNCGHTMLLSHILVSVGHHRNRYTTLLQNSKSLIEVVTDKVIHGIEVMQNFGVILILVIDYFICA